MSDDTNDLPAPPVIDSMSVDAEGVRADLFLQLAPGKSLDERDTSWVRTRLRTIAEYVSAVTR